MGFKPSYGIVSRWGVVAYANSLDTVGVLAKQSSNARSVFGETYILFHIVINLTILIDVIKGYDSRDPTSIPASTRSRITKQILERKLQLGWGTLQSLRIGVPKEYNTEELQPVVRQAWRDTLRKLHRMGHSIHELSLPATKMALSAYYVLAPAEASSNLAKYDGVRYGNKASGREGTKNVLYAVTRGAGFGEEVKRRILLGSYSLSAAAIDNYFIKAQKVRRLVQEDFNKVFALQHPLLETKVRPPKETEVDIILTPTAQSLPPKLSSQLEIDPLEAYSGDVLTVPASLAGLPAMSVPVPISHADSNGADGPHSVGMQILAQYGDDDVVFDMAHIIENM